MSPMPSGSDHPGNRLSRGQIVTYVLILGALTGLGPFTVDLYLPAFPEIQQDFTVDAAVVQLTLTGTMVGFAIGQLIVGPLSDRFGRRWPLILATLLHIAASIGIALSASILLLGILRVVQGFGAAAGGVVAMAMVRDLFTGRVLIRMFSRLALVNGLAPVIAPVLGSWLLTITSWRGIFWVLAGYGALISLMVILFIKETLPPERREKQQKSLRQRYSALFHDRVYVGTVLIAGMTFTGLFAYLSTAPFLFQQVYGFSPQQFGTLFAINSLAIIIGVQTSSRLMDRFAVGPQWILAGTTASQIILGMIIALNGVLGLGMWGTAIPLWFFVLACGFAFPAQQVMALSRHGEQAGTAASILGAMNFGLAGLLSPIIGFLGVDSSLPMAGMMVCAAVLGSVFLWGIVRPRSVPPLFD